MIINSDPEKSDTILSEEGSLQGEVGAMGMYAVGTRPLIDTLHDRTDPTLCQQAWFADDSSAAGKLEEMKKWWEILNEVGPKFGYLPKASKTILIVKDAECYEMASELFGQTGVKITLSGERHLGAVIGSPEFRDEYIKKKVRKWVEDIEQLSKIAEDEPQLAYSAYTKALCMRWCFLQRTIPDTREYFEPIEDAIRDLLIPAIIGRRVNDLERRIISLPVRMGGLGIQNPMLTAEVEFHNSSIITRNLSRIIENQEVDLSNYDSDQVKSDIF